MGTKQHGSSPFTVSTDVKRWFFNHHRVHVTKRKGYVVTVKRTGPGVMGQLGDEVMTTHSWNKLMLYARDQHLAAVRYSRRSAA